MKDSKYEEALERARQGQPIDKIFPELYESEDERIRRKMLEHFRNKTKETLCNIPVKDIIAYLEKQKEPQPAEWSEEDKEMLDAMIDIVSNSLYEPLCPREGMLAWLKSLRPQPKQEWREEGIRTIVDDFVEGRDTYTSCIKRINSLRLQPHWKPSEYTLSLVKKVADGEMLTGMEQMAMETLCNDLQKLL